MNKQEFAMAYVLARAGALGHNIDVSLVIQDAMTAYDAIVAASPQEPAWIEHRGEKPYPEGMVDVELRDGTKCVSVDSDALVWTHDLEHPDSEIIKWRPA